MRAQVTCLLLLLLVTGSVFAEVTKPQTYAYANPQDNSVLLKLQTAESSGDIQGAIAALKDVPSTNRWVGATKGTLVRIYAAHHTSPENPRHVNIKPDEVARALHISDQFRDLIKVASGVMGLSGGTDVITITHTDYELKEVRATFTVSGHVEKGLAAAGSEGKTIPSWIVLLDFTDGGKSTDAEAATITIITGPREPWSISANVPLQKSSDVKLTDDSKSIVLKEAKPKVFYAGFDYTWGDVLSTPKSLGEAMTLKFLLRASRAPLDSYGVALALRGGFWAESYPKANLIHIFDSITPFVGVTRSDFTKDTTDATGKQVRVRGHSIDLQVGLSFDIKKAVDWVQKPAAKSDSEKK